MIRHQIVDEEDLRSDFEEYAQKVLKLKGVATETKLEFYGLYKQATCGACTDQKPGMFDFRGQAKFQAWKDLKDMSGADAMLLYIDLYNSLDESDLNAKDNDEEEENTLKIQSTLYQADADVPENTADIWYACRHGKSDTVRECFTPDMASAVDDSKRTLLHWAVDRNHLELVQWLVKQGCDVDAQDDEGSTVLHYAVTCEYLPIVQYLIKSGASRDVKDEDGCTALELCDTDEIRTCFDKLKIT